MNATALRAAAAALVIGLPAALGAVSAAQAQDVPTYAQPSQEGEENIHGRIIAFDGAYNLQVRDERGFVDNVQLHQGTIINPTGLTLEPGMIVSILGYNAGPYFAANEVDTPYTYYGGVPWYAGHPWYYYGPSVGLSFFFGNAGWWHGREFGAPYRWVGGARVYHPGTIRGTYHGGAFHGRNYVAPRARGGYVPHGRAPVSHARGGERHH
ncbi:MAG TPA: hypothetical protein VFB22_02005 [Candidatus Baltobacteraceae bacterium]|nr:hypothetical protein [Candidatus Baltobacteraceae bacterium]